MSMSMLLTGLLGVLAVCLLFWFPQLVMWLPGKM